ncbi:ATP-dependent RNA helicase dbp7 [Fulvia fulva]|uniref:ATP-dependent RNA helicase n=1 Tax=Passalora fulva TaxID=5499 RepID=A0A9Q8USQ4_PASFU|nr:ATP-dependent RNA helicase dbp7 [Fulvia fulva]KAK4618060.1 ATP-dependent RNA helicase dbp7 [Fulvia fulva]KAK4618886.1 ATP-dependent RNA helicase dbp7 [Fulvia fulva]UJO21010.1 ATP-dependent RNA helicase dbp7 [Fulvia fulva]WPV17826.1 ATP-dependent RNA helicase dbp7 [Fulvia fulva]WPV33652.1 ATP-dependent RNA helicase dbp7 [Fulvia fulva]
MADDGMMLNFELPVDAFSAPQSRLKGGSWKDRLTARKSAEYGRMKAQERASKPQAEQEQAPAEARRQSQYQGERPVKRPRIDRDRSDRPRKHVDTLPKLNNGEVVSSLFSFNPASKAPVEKPTTEAEEDVQPSNAPLVHDETAQFTALGLSPNLAGHLLRKLDIKAPTAIQRKAVEQLCKHDTDAFIQAQTGSGKTLAYLLPIVERITTISRRMKDDGENFDRQSGLFGIVLAPTRELAKQIETVLESILRCCHWVVAGMVIGGENKNSEKARLRKGVNILVATPGRLADHLNHTEVLDVSTVRWLVLDEGDRLMEQGFEEDIQRIIGVMNLRNHGVLKKPIPGLPTRRTTVLCSATIKSTVEQLRSIALKDPVSISVDAAENGDDTATTTDNNFSAPAQLKQSYAVVPPKQRLVSLVGVLKQTFKKRGNVMKCIVFISCADSVDFHFELLSRGSDAEGAPATATGDGDAKTQSPPKNKNANKRARKPGSIPQGNTIVESRTEAPATAFSPKDNQVKLYRLHGSLQQATRTSTLKSFTNSEDPAVLICTDVAARGLDLPNVDLVIEYDPPFSKDDHLHRIGRTARAGRDGRAMIFLQPGPEEGYVEILKEGKPRNLTRHDASELLRKGFSATSGVGNMEKGWEERATEFQLDVERWVSESSKHLEQARRAYQSHIRAYATHVAAERSIFNMQELHLGHLAKAFALRDKPGSIKVPGLRPGAKEAGKNRDARKSAAGKAAGGKSRVEDDIAEETDATQARYKMQRMSRKMGGVSEFNLG